MSFINPGPGECPMKFATLARSSLLDDNGTEGYQLRRGTTAIRAGANDILINYDGENLDLKIYAAGDLQNVWEHIETTDSEMVAWRDDEENPGPVTAVTKMTITLD